MACAAIAIFLFEVATLCERRETESEKWKEVLGVKKIICRWAKQVVEGYAKKMSFGRISNVGKKQKKS